MTLNFSENDIELLGYANARKEKAGGEWEIYFADAIAGIRTIPTRFVYLKSGFQKDSVQSLRVALQQGDNRDTIFFAPQSFGLSEDTLKKELSTSVKLFRHEDVIWEKTRTTFADYLEDIKQSVPSDPNYITTRKQGASPDSQLDNEILDYLLGRRSANTLKVVKAPAGVGKTTLARHLTVKLAQEAHRNRVIPAYVEAAHWGKLNLETVEELWEIIFMSFRNFTPNISISERLFNVCLEKGNAVFIFDGFDELCGHRNSRFDPNQVLEKLSDISKNFGAKIVITTRSLYWDSEIESVPPNVDTVEIAPFNTQQAKGYLQKRFRDDQTSLDRAFTLYSKLEESNVPPEKGGARAKFVNLPLCVGMIADYVIRGGEREISPRKGKSLVREVLLQICERERARKSLTTTSEVQLQAFEEIAVNFLDNETPQFALDLLEIAGFDTKDIEKVIDHPLLKSGGAAVYQFHYDFLPQYLRAFFVYNSIAEKRTPIDLWKLMSKEARGKSSIIEHAKDLFSISDVDILKTCVETIPTNFKDARSFVFHLLCQVIEKNKLSASERTNLVFPVVCGDAFPKDRRVNDLHIVGRIDSMDLRGVEFRDCTFTDTIFYNCEVDKNTLFSRCTFFGELSFQKCDRLQWSVAKRTECKENAPTNLEWQKFTGKISGKREELIEDTLKLALGKFWHNGRVRKSIRKDNWKTGSFGHSVYCDAILDAMLNAHILTEITISSCPEGGYGFSLEVVPDLQRYMDNRQLTGKIKEVYEIVLREAE